MTARWKLANPGNPVDRRYLIIELDGIRIANVFPDAVMYHGKVEPQWVIEQAKLIVDTMNAVETREAIP